MVFCFPLDRWVAGWWLSVVGCCWAVFGVGWWWCGSGVTPLPEYLPAKWKTLKATTSSQMGKTGDTLKSIFNVDVSPPHRPLYDPHFSEAFSSLCTISPSCLLFIHVSVCSRLSLTFDVPLSLISISNSGSSSTIHNSTHKMSISTISLTRRPLEM